MQTENMYHNRVGISQSGSNGAQKNITDFMALARKEVKAANPRVSFGTYTRSLVSILL
ncbi:hypothetical protein NXX48_24125 [Bacteroides faecis]|nr:hypothetical protein [Bacteroides faecis]